MMNLCEKKRIWTNEYRQTMHFEKVVLLRVRKKLFFLHEKGAFFWEELKTRITRIFTKTHFRFVPIGEIRVWHSFSALINTGLQPGEPRQANPFN